MALKATVLKARLNISDMDRGYYQEHAFSLAQHPSETPNRIMVRLLAFMLNASETLAFSKGLSDEGEPELAERDLTGDITLWVAFGQPDEKWLRKASAQAKAVKLYTYGGRTVPLWLAQNKAALARLPDLEIWEFSDEDLDALTGWFERSMNFQCSITEGVIYLSKDDDALTITPIRIKERS